MPQTNDGPEPVTVSIKAHSEQITKQLADVMKQLAENFSQAGVPLKSLAEAMTKAGMPPLGSQADYTLMPEPPKGVQAADIAKAFDVPLELIAPECVNQIPEAPKPELPVHQLKTPIDWAKLVESWKGTPMPPITSYDHQADAVAIQKLYEQTFQADPWLGEDTVHWEHLGTATDVPSGWATASTEQIIEQLKAAAQAPKLPKTPLSNHAWGTAVDINGPEGAVHQHFDPEPGEMYFEGDGDLEPNKKVFALSFDVLGKAQPVVFTPKPTLIWETELGKVTQMPSGMASVQLTGTVSTAQGLFQVGADLVTEDLELAKKLIGVPGYENAGPGTGTLWLEQVAGNEVFTWEAGTGWVKKEPEPELKVLTFADYPDLEPFPVEHTGPDGSLWRFRFEGGWQRSKAEDSLFGSAKDMAPHGWFCSYCKEHASVHSGDLVGCDSGGWLRPATATEHKLALLQK